MNIHFRKHNFVESRVCNSVNTVEVLSVNFSVLRVMKSEEEQAEESS